MSNQNNIIIIPTGTDIDGSRNGVKLSELIQKTKLLDTDILLVEDENNTKTVTFKNLLISAIRDNDYAADWYMWSSAKIKSLVDELSLRISNGIESVNGSISDLEKKVISTEIVNALEEELKSQIENKLDTSVATSKFNSKRDKDVPITSADLDTSSDGVKIKLVNLAEEVINAITGQAKITVSASAPNGGWLGSDIANYTITRGNLAETYRFVANVTEGNIDTLTKDGFYLLGYKVEGLPKMNEDDDETRIMKVDRISTDYIIQTVYYTSNVDERPVYIRRGRLSTLYLATFREVHEVSPYYRIGRDMLKDEFMNNGIISEGEIFSYRSEGYYYAKGTFVDNKTPRVTNLPTDDNYFVTVEKHGDEYLYIAELITDTICKVYHARLYLANGYVPNNPEWYLIFDSSKSKFDTKKVVLFGDESLFETGGVCIASILREKYGMSINSDHAKESATISFHNDSNLEKNCVLTQIANAQATLETAEYAIILAGTHDWEVPISELGLNNSNIVSDDDDTYENTFRTALVGCIRNILQANPKVKLLICTPFYRGSKESNDNKDADSYMVNDKYLRDFVNVMKDVTDYYHIPVEDLYSTSGIKTFNSSTYLKDGISLNDDGHILVADKIYKAMERYY